MDLLSIPKKEKEYRCKFAAPSILTGRFVAHILDAEEEDIRETLTDPGTLIVYNEHVITKEYEGYKKIDSMEEQRDGGYIVKLSGNTEETGAETNTEENPGGENDGGNH